MLNKNNPIPKHIAIIMDGNGRWAKKRKLPRTMGHKAGVNIVKNITIRANELGVSMLTVYAFSTENWSRPQDEVSYIMGLPKLLVNKFLPDLVKNNVKIQLIGDTTKLPDKTMEVLQHAIDETKDNTGIQLVFAINYGGHEEIVQASKTIAQKVKDGLLEIDSIDDHVFSDHLFTAQLDNYTNPDLMIRTSGEIRLSNFLLWQLAYSEFYFTDVLWPDFTEEEFDKAIEAYGQRQRRFGKV